MQYHEFLAKVRERGEYETKAEVEQVVRSVLAVLGMRLAGGEARDLAGQLPDEVSDVLITQEGQGRSLGLERFLEKVAARLSSHSVETARWDASAVLSTLAEGIDGGELNQVLSQLPSGYAPLFGHPELA